MAATELAQAHIDAAIREEAAAVLDNQDSWIVRLCTDTIRKAKQRAFAHASERCCGISCREEISCFEVDGLGDLTLEHQMIGLRVRLAVFCRDPT
ncbi:MAG: hypothetical protein FWD68_15390 [Alphaproteobacteria bacterium]|nr:hypothetical protein [Alphaproteobacteria bacterium]